MSGWRRERERRGENERHPKNPVDAVKEASRSAASTAGVSLGDRFDSASRRRRLSVRVKGLIKESRQVESLTEM